MRVSCNIIDQNFEGVAYYKPFSFLLMNVDIYESSSFFKDCTDVTFLSGETVSMCIPFAQFNQLMQPEHRFYQKLGLNDE